MRSELCSSTFTLSALSVIPDPGARLVLMGIAMGVTASAIIVSPMGRRSGAHFNPVVSLTFYFLGKIHWLDTLLYIAAQFVGGVLGVLAARVAIGPILASPSVLYVVTQPGRLGLPAAFFAEFFMGFLTMTVVLRSANHPALSRFTWLFVGLLVATYVVVFSPVSGFSMNPARTVSSAVFANVWTALWIYFSAPMCGMLLAAGFYVITAGQGKVYCAKLYHTDHGPCPFRCRYKQLFESKGLP